MEIISIQIGDNNIYDCRLKMTDNIIITIKILFNQNLPKSGESFKQSSFKSFIVTPFVVSYEINSNVIPEPVIDYLKSTECVVL